MVDQVASIGTGQVATSSGLEVGAGGAAPELARAAAATFVQADWLRTKGPTPVSTSSDRSTPLDCAMASAAVQQAGEGATPGVASLGKNALGAAQARSTTRVAGICNGPRSPRKSASPSAVTSPPPKRVKPSTA